MSLFYHLGILVFNALLSVVALFNAKARMLVEGRRETMRRIKDLDLDGRTTWIHCASLGEFEQGRPVIERIKKKNPQQRVVLTFFSPSGYEVQKDYALADVVLYLPADRPSNVKKFVTAICPQEVIFVKYEFWYYFLKYLHQQGIKTYIISAIFRPQHAFFKWYGGWYRKMLHYFTKLYVQDELSGQLLSEVGIDHYQVAGDTRFDRVFEIAQNAKEYPELEQFACGSIVMIGGSSWPAGEKLIADYLRHNPDFKLLLAPHEIHEAHLQQIEALFSDFSCARYSKLAHQELKKLRIIIVDTMGMLSSMYRYGHVAYIGGGFGSGIHNTIEASTFGLPVVIGPNYKKYQEACDLIQLQAGFSVADSAGFIQVMDRLLKDASFLAKSSEAAVNYVNKMRGSTEVIVEQLFN